MWYGSVCCGGLLSMIILNTQTAKQMDFTRKDQYPVNLLRKGKNHCRHKDVMHSVWGYFIHSIFLSWFPGFCCIFPLLTQCCVPGFKGKDCSLDIDLCSFGLCSENTLICTETRDGHNVSCTCKKGKGSCKSLSQNENII